MKSMPASLQEPQHTILNTDSLVRYYDQATKSKIDKHLTDINDTITEEDIRNIDTNITLQMLQKLPSE